MHRVVPTHLYEVTVVIPPAGTRLARRLDSGSVDAELFAHVGDSRTVASTGLLQPFVGGLTPEAGVGSTIDALDVDVDVDVDRNADAWMGARPASP